MPYKPDAVTATMTAGADFEKHPEGSHLMVCVDVINLGTKVQEDLQGKNPPRLVPRVALVFASGERDSTSGELLTVQTEFTVSMHEKSNLRPFLAAWRGKSYTDPEALAGAPLEKLAGKPAFVTVEHKQSKQGRTFANIAAISPLPKQMRDSVTDLSNDYARGAWWSKKKDAYAEESAKFAASHPSSKPQMPRGNDGDDDLPF